MASSPGFGCDLRGTGSESDRFWGGRVRVQFGLSARGFGFGSISQGQVRVRFEFACPGSESDRFGIGSDSHGIPHSKPGPCHMYSLRNADAIAVGIQVFSVGV